MEKRLIAVIAALCAIILVFCTMTAQRNYESKLPHVQAQQVQTDADGNILLPPEAIFIKADGTFCAYRLVAETGSFGMDRYWVKEVRISCAERPDGLMEVRGLYDLSAPYVTAATAPLGDSTEVIWNVQTP